MRSRRAALVTGALLLLAALGAAAATDWSAQDYTLYPGDFDGDNKTDLLYVAKDQARSSGIARSDGSAPNLPFQSWPSNYLGIPWSGDAYRILVADFNGDGRSDLFLQRATPGDSFLLFADANGRITAIAQTVANGALGLEWSADKHRLIAGDFSGDGKADLFLQATSPSGLNAPVIADSEGRFTVAAQQSWTDASWSAFKWSTRNANLFAGDFNGDGRDDLLVQAKPRLVQIDYDVVFPVPNYRPNSNGVLISQSGASPFSQVGVQQWSRNAHGVNWAPNAATVVVGDFDNDGRDDVLLQARREGRPSYRIPGNASGAVFTSGVALATNVTWNSSSYRLIAGNFDGTSGAGIYFQALTSSGTNQYANTVTGGSVSVTAHNTALASGVMPATAVGHTPGSFAVSSDGAATYSIPIVVPPGVAGVQPALSIDYASGSGNGLLGTGWSLGGLSQISRCHKTKVQDNSNDVVQLTSVDRFCLDGNKLRLTSGVYGVAGSTYQTELETFARVTAQGTAGNGPASFKVEAKNGLVFQYGSTADSRIESLNGGTTPRAWALSSVSDRAGNSMTITYEEDGAPNGSFRPATFTYTANAAASLAAAYKVNLVWESRPAGDHLLFYIGGGAVRETRRLKRIETQYNEPGVGWRAVRTYHLSYNNSGISARSRLAALQECDRDAKCLAPTTISWQDGTFGWPTAEIGSTTLPASAASGFPIDMNGDGRSDYAYFDTGINYWRVMFANSDGTYQSPISAFAGSAATYLRALPMDVNGDGRRDLLVPHPTDGKWWWVRHVSGASFATSATTTSHATPGGTGAFPADVDGDGREDIVSATGNTVYVALNQSTGGSASFASATAVWTTPFAQEFWSFGTAGDFVTSPFVTADFNGDGRGDVLVLTREDATGGEPGVPQAYLFRWHMLQSLGGTLSSVATVISSTISLPRPLLLDVNADGLTDLAYRYFNPSTLATTWHVRVSTGSLGPPTETTVAASGEGAVSDCDADGYLDLVYSVTGGTFRCLKSDGTSLATAALELGAAGGQKVGDVNGDGMPDFLGLDGSNVLKVRLHRGVMPDLVSSIADGLGNTVSVAYAPLTDSSVHTPGSGAVFPEMDVQPASYVVKQYTTSDGTGGTYAVTNKYAGARVHVQGRGLLGFASQESIDGRNGLRTTASFAQAFPYIGFVTQTSIYQSSTGPLITRVTNTPATLVTDSTAFTSRMFPFASPVVQESYEVGGPGNALPIAQVTQTTTLSSYGDPATVTTVTADQTGSGLSYTTSTTNTYATADVTNWCVSFVERQAVASTVPVHGTQTRTIDYVKDASAPAQCRVLQEIVEPTDTTGTVKVTATNTFDLFGNVNSQTVTAANIQARTTSMNFQQGVFPTTVTNAENEATGNTFDLALGVLLTTTDPNQQVVTLAYDGFGRLKQVTRPDNTKTTFGYVACTPASGYCGDSRLRYQVERQELDSSNGVIRSSRQLFDAYGRSLYDQSQTLSGAFATVATNYDNYGRLQQRSQPFFTGQAAYFTTTSYDLIGRPTQQQRRISEADSGTQTVSYAYNRLTHTFTDVNSKQVTTTFNALGQPVQVGDAGGGLTSYDYDPFGNLKKTIDPLNNEIRNTFNIRGFKTRTEDPDFGAWNYTFYPTGELWTQTNAKSQVLTLTYDRVARLKTRQEPEGTATFTFGTSAALRNVGRIVSVTSTAVGSPSESFAYDTLGRLQDATTTIDSTAYVVSNAYSAATGLLETITYPTSTAAVSGSRFKVKYEYAHGLLQRTRDFHTPSTVYWEQIASNAAGQPIDEQYGNGLHTYSTYDGITGLLQARTAGATSQIQYLTYQWDKAGNLKERKDQRPGLAQTLTETFTYDNLYRLDQSHLNSTLNLDVAHNSIGNITSMTGVGTYAYPSSGSSSVRPHAATAAGAGSYVYNDANGNMTGHAGGSVSWYSYDKPNLIDRGGGTSSQFFYGADRSRFKQIAVTAAGGVLPAGTETTLYVAGGLFERVTKPSGVIEYKHYIVGDAEPVAIRTLRSNSVNDTRYLHKDHLGSIDTITDESGGVVARLSYDAFGNRRNPATWSGTPSAGEWSTIAAVTHRGFTFHEHLDNVGLIHMNGRVFDQKIGRFLSADPFVQAPGFSQSFNRYSYTFNNPLSFVDPSGYEAQGPDDERNDYAPSRFLYSFFSSVQRGFYYNGVSGRCTACALSRQYANEHRLPREPARVGWTGAGVRGSTIGRTFGEDSAIRRRAVELRSAKERNSQPLTRSALNLAALDFTFDGTGAALDIARGLSLVDLRISGTHWVRTFDGYWQANRLTVPARQLLASSDGFGGRGLARTTMRGISYAGLVIDAYQLYDAAANDRSDEAVLNAVDVTVGVGSVFVPPLGVGYFLGKGVGTLIFPDPEPSSVFDRLGEQ